MSDRADLLEALRRAGTPASATTLDRALYASDASLYRVVPAAVAKPRSREELVAAVTAAHALRVPVTVRGAGTSIAGNAVGQGLVVDVSRLARVLAVSAEQRTAVVEPGVVQASLQAAVAPHGLRFGPDPSTHTRCTLGGMIGNNACGSRALGFGRTSDNVLGLEVLWGNGSLETLGGPSGVAPSGAAGSTSAALAALGAAHLAPIRQGFGHFARQGSGYALEHLLPERLAPHRLVVGSEGTLGVVLAATVALVEEPVARVMLLLGYPSMAEAADAVPSLLASVPVASADGAGLLALEGLDARIVDVVRARGGAVPDLPRGAGWLFAEIAAGSEREAVATATRVAAGMGRVDHRVVADHAEQAVLWRIREDGAGLAGRSLGRPAYSGWEDAAVPPARLGTWLRRFEELLGEHGLDAVPYGHFGDGCVHARIDFTFDDGGARFRAFVTDAAREVAALGGSLSGEHGDGRARSELLPLMYDERSLALFAAVKQACDPDNLLNPGVLVDPAPLDAGLRPSRPVAPVPIVLGADRTLGEAVHRCTGVGKCVAPAGGVMCPSWKATRDEKDSTRGRARILQEALDGSLVRGLDDPAVHDALDLCLSCKGCARDCPAGVDMAAYKAEVLAQTWRGRLRPRQHYTLGRLPTWLRLAPTALAARALARPGLAGLAGRLAGVDPRRSLPELPAATLRELARGHRPDHHESPPGTRGAPTGRPDVWIWADSFTDHLTPSAGVAALRLLEAAGLRAEVIPADACCGLTRISTGQLAAARRIAGRAVDRLHPYVASGTPVVGLEPSCLATLRDDLPRLVAGAPAREVASGVRTLAELLTDLGWTPPDLTGVTVVAQPHCHHVSVLGWEADAALLRRAGAAVTRVGGCCGLAGDFGMTPEHYEVSVAIAATSLLPAVREAGPDVVVLADGFSCRYQLADLAGVRAVHLAELLADAGNVRPAP